MNHAKIFLGLIFLLVMLAPAMAGIGELAPYLFFAVSIPLMAYIFLVERSIPPSLDLYGRILLGVFAIQVILAAISARTPSDIAFGLNFLPMLLYIPLLAIFSSHSMKNPVLLFARLSLFSSLATLALALTYSFVFEFFRAEAPRVNPLGLAGVAINSGFFALLGFRESSGWKKHLLLLGPVAALIVIYITQTRGLFLTFLPMLAVSLLFLLKGKWRLATSIAIIVAIGGAALLAGVVFGFGRWQFITSLPSALAGGEIMMDDSLSIRLVMLAAGFQAFLQAPLFGHGWANIMSSVLEFVHDENQRNIILGLAHLHNDLMDFAVTGGLVGIATYLAMIGGPVFAVLKMQRDSSDFARLMAVALLTTSYFFRGLSDLMFGFEANSLYYVAFLAIFFGLFTKPGPKSIPG